MAVLSAESRTRAQWRKVGKLIQRGAGWLLFALPWMLAKLLRAVGSGIGTVLFAAGWLASSALWPALCWCGAAARLGWREGCKPGGGQRGSS